MNASVNRSLGPYNDYKVKCAPTGVTQSYSTCLRVAQAFDTGVIRQSFPECQACLTAGTCPARVMRQQEIDADESLYFKESPLKAIHEAPPVDNSHSYKSDKTSESYQRGYASVGAVRKPAAPVVKKQTKESLNVTSVNPHRALLEAEMKIAETKEVSTAPRGEKMLAFIKRVRGETL